MNFEVAPSKILSKQANLTTSQNNDVVCFQLGAKDILNWVTQELLLMSIMGARILFFRNSMWVMMEFSPRHCSNLRHTHVNV